MGWVKKKALIGDLHILRFLGHTYILKSNSPVTVDDMFWWLMDIGDHIWGIE